MHIWNRQFIKPENQHSYSLNSYLQEISAAFVNLIYKWVCTRISNELRILLFQTMWKYEIKYLPWRARQTGRWIHQRRWLFPNLIYFTLFCFALLCFTLFENGMTMDASKCFLKLSGALVLHLFFRLFQRAVRNLILDNLRKDQHKPFIFFVSAFVFVS